MFSGDLLGFHGIFNGICWDFSKKHWDQMGLTMQLVDPIRHGYLQENRNHRNTGCPKCLVQYHLVPKISEWHFWGKKSILLNINEYHHFASLSDSHFFGGVATCLDKAAWHSAPIAKAPEAPRSQDVL
jgi:hypothetical protein